MKRLIYVCYMLGVLGMLTGWSHAQTTACFIDLSAAAASLVQAQARASSGDTAAALAKLRELQAQLDVIIANCEGMIPQNIVPPPDVIAQPTATATTPPIPTRFTATNGILSFLLPAGWVAIEQGNSVFIGSSATTAQGLSQFTPPVGDNLGAGLILGTPRQLAPTVRTGANFVDVLVAYQSQLRLGGFAVGDELTPVSWQNKPAGRFIFQNNAMAGIMQVIDLQSDDLHLLIFIMSAPTYVDALETTLNDLLDSIQIDLP